MTLAEIIRAFCADALSSAIYLNADVDEVLTAILARFDPAPVERMARTGLAFPRCSRIVQQPRRVRSGRHDPHQPVGIRSRLRDAPSLTLCTVARITG
jgi:hypothetical protein